MTRITRALDESAGVFLAAVLFAVAFIIVVAAGTVVAIAIAAGVVKL